MSATAQRPAGAAEPVAAALDRADGIELLGHVHGSGYESGACLVRRADGQMVQLGPLMYALLECIDGERHISELSRCVSEKLGRDVDDAHVVALAEKLARQGLLAGAEEHAPPKRNPLLGLRWRVVVTNPAVTSRLTAPFVQLFRPWIVWPVIAAFLAVAWFVVVEEGVAGATSDAFRSPELLLLVVGLTF